MSARTLVATVLGALAVACTGGDRSVEPAAGASASAAVDATPPASVTSTSIAVPTTRGPSATTAVPTTSTTTATTAVSTTHGRTTTTVAATTTDPRSGHDACVEHEGRFRCWLEHAPVDPDEPSTLVIDLHGYTGDARGQQAISGFRELADRDRFVVVWPEGVDRSWSAGACCGPQVADDVGFLREVVADVSRRHAVDRVAVTGLSNGCAMAQRMAAQASDIVDVVACMSFYLLSDAAREYSPVPVLEIHGTADPVIAYGVEPVFGGAVGNYERWRSLNGCAGPDEERRFGGDAGTIRFDLSCAAGAVVALVSLVDTGHVPYRGIDTDLATSELAWRFMIDPVGAVAG